MKYLISLELLTTLIICPSLCATEYATDAQTQTGKVNPPPAILPVTPTSSATPVAPANPVVTNPAAATPEPAAAPGSWASTVNTAAPQKQRTDSINFDDELIESMNHNPFEALTQVGKKDDRDQGHLYHKKSNFKHEMKQSAQDMGYTQ